MAIRKGERKEVSDEVAGWVNSVERDIEILEGQIAIAQTIKTSKIAINVDSARRLLDLIESLQRRIAEMEQRP